VIARAASLALALALATSAAADCPDLKPLSRATRLEQSVKWVSPTVVGIIASLDDANDVPTEEMERMAEAAREAYSPMAISEDVERGLARRCDPDVVAKLNEFYRSPLGVKIVRGSMELLEDRRAARTVQAILKEADASGRLALARETKSATLVYALSAQARVALWRPAIGVSLSTLFALRNEPSPRAEDVTHYVTLVSADQAPLFDMLTDLGQLYSVRDLTTGELEEYRAFLDAPPGRWYRDELQRAFDDALQAAGKRLVVGVGAPVRAP